MIFLIAYLLTGIAVVAFDFQKPFHDRPAYVRRPSQHLSMILIVIVAWLPIRLYAANRGRQWGDLIRAAVTFLVLVIGGMAFA